MNDEAHATWEDIMNDAEPQVLPTPVEIHEFYPVVSDTEALAFYNQLREANPWLPDPMKVPSGSDLELHWGRDQLTTLTFSVYIKLPADMIPEEQA